MATSSKAKKKTVRLASGRKRARQDVKLNAANTALRSKFRTVIKNVQKAVTAGDKSKAADLFKAKTGHEVKIQFNTAPQIAQRAPAASGGAWPGGQRGR